MRPAHENTPENMKKNDDFYGNKAYNLNMERYPDINADGNG